MHIYHRRKLKNCVRVHAFIYRPTCTTHCTHSQENNQEIKPREIVVGFNDILPRDEWWYWQKDQKGQQVTPEDSCQEIPAYQGQTCQ